LFLCLYFSGKRILRDTWIDSHETLLDDEQPDDLFIYLFIDSLIDVAASNQFTCYFFSFQRASKSIVVVSVVVVAVSIVDVVYIFR